MAKQTFTTGQVLTAAQMTSLQQTAMDGGAASAKTASYTLVAADAGTAISMSNASATTITVNTALFAAGDTVYITNLGVGVCTITAGTATVNTSSSLALGQYEGGTLDFTSSSSAVFLKADGASAASGGMTLISTTTLSGSTTSVSSIPNTYNSLMFVIRGMTASASGEPRFKINGSTTNHEFVGVFNGGSAIEATNNNGAQMTYGNNMDETDDDNCWTLKIDNYTSSTTPKSWTFYGTYVKTTGGVSKAKIMLAGGYSLTTAVSSLDIVASSGTFSGGSILTYGVK